MELKGKKINFLGDSITYGACLANPSESCFPTLIGKMAGLAEVRNYGVCGACYAIQYTCSGNKAADDAYFCSRIDEMDPDADAVVVFGGTNDFGHGDAPIGTFADRTPGTFYGACHYLMAGLINRYPGKEIVILTPLHRIIEGKIKEDGSTFLMYVNAIREVAAYYSLPVLDMYLMSGFQPLVPVIRERFMPDGLHPNEAGHEIIARRVMNFLAAL